MTDELKPVRCGCGGKAESGFTTSGLIYVACCQCLTETRLFRTEAEAITAWNRAMSGSAENSSTVERKTGEWLPHPGDEDWDVCSVCGTGCKRREHGTTGDLCFPWVTEYNYQFCPNCGADMRGEYD